MQLTELDWKYSGYGEHPSLNATLKIGETDHIYTVFLDDFIKIIYNTRVGISASPHMQLNSATVVQAQTWCLEHARTKIDEYEIQNSKANPALSNSELIDILDKHKITYYNIAFTEREGKSISLSCPKCCK